MSKTLISLILQPQLSGKFCSILQYFVAACCILAETCQDIKAILAEVQRVYTEFYLHWALLLTSVVHCYLEQLLVRFIHLFYPDCYIKG